MACIPKITKNIISNCETNRVGGIEQESIIVANRSDLIYTVADNVVSSISMKVGAKAYELKGVKKLLSVGSEAVFADNRPKMFAHMVKFSQFETLADDLANVDAMDDIVVISENKHKNLGGDGTFQLRGLVSGLWGSVDTVDSNTDNGVRNLEFKSMAQQEEKYSTYVVLDTDYATTKAMVYDLLNVGA